MPVIKAFTLVELIIVITVLLILSTVVFYSVTWFIKEARDVSRFENLKRIDFWIELFVTEKWFYPEPDNAKEITFSWGQLWKQGVFWDNLLLTVWNLSGKPVDLVSLNDFAYSLANDKKQYELWAVLEWDDIVYNSIFPQTYARSKINVRSMVVWNYNWKVLNVFTWWLLYILAIPTVLSYDTTETDIVELTNRQTLAYKWYWNIASAYSWTVFKIDWWFEFDPSILVVYSGTYDNFINNESERINLLDNTQQAYSGWILDWDPNLDDILWVDIDLTNPSKETREEAYDLVTEDLNITLPIELTSGDDWLTYDLTNSLLDGDTRSITQDSVLNMWFATKNGVFTFEWNTWWSYTEADWLVDKDVRVVLESAAWHMCFATNKWISKFDWTTWIDYTESNWLIDDDVVAMIQDSSNIMWFGTKKWVSRFDWTNWTDYDKSDWLANKIVTWLAEDTSWHIWASTINWVSRFNGVNWITYNESNWLVDKSVLSVYADSVWNVWFGTINWISKFDWTTWTTYNEDDWLIDKYVNDIFEDSEWNMWFSTVAWASKFDWTTWTDYTINEWLADNDVQIIYEDNEWNIWFGTKKWVTIYFK